jgi:hypothetical protein
LGGSLGVLKQSEGLDVAVHSVRSELVGDPDLEINVGKLTGSRYQQLFVWPIDGNHLVGVVFPGVTSLQTVTSSRRSLYVDVVITSRAVSKNKSDLIGRVCSHHCPFHLCSDVTAGRTDATFHVTTINNGSSCYIQRTHQQQ